MNNQTITNLRTNAITAFQAGISAADPKKALKIALEKTPIPLIKNNGSYIIISIGKAACKMAECALEAIPKSEKTYAIAVTNFENIVPVEGCEVIGASHPIPCINGFNASKKIINCLTKTTPNDIVLMLVSGGSSALIPAPVDGISLEDKVIVNKVLISSGFDIYETNLVRQSLSLLKGGGILEIATPATVHSYILSDVLGDDLRVVGSGPSVGPLGNLSDAKKLLKNKNIFSLLPINVQNYYDYSLPPNKLFSTEHTSLIAGNANSVRAMAKKINATLVLDPLIGDVQDAARKIVTLIAKQIGKGPFSIAIGGETTVKITGSGKGGRNQELALRVACELELLNIITPWCFLSGGTDGRDGPTDAAGGLVDNTTIKRIIQKGKNINDYLESNDSYHALELVDNLLKTGATGTNVADLQLFISA